MRQKLIHNNATSDKKHIHLLQHNHFSPSKIIFFSVLAVLFLAGIFVYSGNRARQLDEQAVAGASTISVSALTSVQLRNVYFTFSTFRYGKYASPYQLRIGDMLYLKNFDNSKLKLLQIFLYDYTKRGNQEIIQSRITTQSRYVRTKYTVPSGRRYAYVAKFQDRVTGEIATKYFALYVLPKITLQPTPTPTMDYSIPWTVAPNCPLTTLACVPCTTGSDCRYEPANKDLHGFRGWACQNNNPGNIRNSSTNMSTDFKNKMIIRNGGTAACGVRNDSRGGSYFVFATYAAGYGALKAYVKGVSNGEHSSYAGTGWACGNCTLSQFFSKYSPGDGTYATRVATYINEPVTQTLTYVVAHKLDLFVDAIKEREGFFVQ